MEFSGKDKIFELVSFAHGTEVRIKFPGKDHFKKIAVVQKTLDDNWRIQEVDLESVDMRSVNGINRLRFDSENEAATFVSMFVGQVVQARDNSPVPEEIRSFLNREADTIRRDVNSLKDQWIRLHGRARGLRYLAKKFNIQEPVWLLEQNDIGEVVKKIVEFKLENGEHPFFSEGTLYDLLGKEDARTVLVHIRNLIELVSPEDIGNL